MIALFRNFLTISLKISMCVCALVGYSTVIASHIAMLAFSEITGCKTWRCPKRLQKDYVAVQIPSYLLKDFVFQQCFS